MTPPVQISTRERIAAYGFSRKVGAEQRLHIGTAGITYSAESKTVEPE